MATKSEWCLHGFGVDCPKVIV